MFLFTEKSTGQMMVVMAFLRKSVKLTWMVHFH